MTVANNGYGGSTDLTIESGQKETLDLNTLKGEGPKFGNILFAVDVEDAIIQIDGKVIDTEEAVPIQYGVHSLAVTAPGYDTYNKKLFVNSKEATIVIGMSGDGSGTETEKTADSVTNETDTTTDGAAGSLAGSLAGSHTAGESSGTTAGTSVGSSTGTSTGDSLENSSGILTDGTSGTGTGDGTSTGSSTDYLSTLSELLSTLSGNSN